MFLAAMPCLLAEQMLNWGEWNGGEGGRVRNGGEGEDRGIGRKDVTGVYCSTIKITDDFFHSKIETVQNLREYKDVNN